MISESALRSPKSSGCTEHWNLMCCLATEQAREGPGLRLTPGRQRRDCSPQGHLTFYLQHWNEDTAEVMSVSGTAFCVWFFFNTPGSSHKWVVGHSMQTKPCLCSSASVIISYFSCLMHCAFLCGRQFNFNTLVFDRLCLFVHILALNTVFGKNERRMFLEQNTTPVTSRL